MIVLMHTLNGDPYTSEFIKILNTYDY